MRGKLEHAFKETAVLKREKHSMLLELESLKKQLELYQTSSGGTVNHVGVAKDTSGSAGVLEQNSTSDISKEKVVLDVKPKVASDTSSKSKANSETDFVDKLLAKQDSERDKDTGSSSGHSDRSSKSGKSGKQRTKPEDTSSPPESQLQQQISVLQLKLQQAQKTLHRERE